MTSTVKVISSVGLVLKIGVGLEWQITRGIARRIIV